MRIVHVSHLDGGTTGGGANKAAWRLHQTLRLMGADSHMCVLIKTTRDPAVHPLFRPPLLAKIAWRMRSIFNGRALRAYPRHPACGWAELNISSGIVHRIARLAPDIVHIHTPDSMLSYGDFPRLPGKTCWTLHDMEGISGGCHYAVSCTRYRSHCGHCPELGSADALDLAHSGWEKMATVWRETGMTAIAPSTWLYREAQASPVLGPARVVHLANGIDTDVFNPDTRSRARREFGFDDKTFYFLAGAASLANPLKGFQLIRDVAPRLTRLARPVKLVLFGGGHATIDGLPTHQLGFVADERRMAAAYAACDAFVAPSLIDNLPTTLIESIACGTPGITFNTGGCPDIVRTGITGWVVPEVTDDSLFATMREVVETPTTIINEIRRHCRNVAVAEYNQQTQAQNHINVYRAMLTHTGPADQWA